MEKTPKQDAVEENPNFSSLGLILMGVIAIPLALLLWFGNIFVFHISSNIGEEIEHIPPTRWLASIGIPLIGAVLGYRNKSVNKSGAISGFTVAFFLTLSSYCFSAGLMALFFLGSKATKYRSQEKKKFEKDFKEGGQRNWVQVICNGGMAAFLAILYILDYGSGEIAVNFSTQYRASWLSVGILGAFSCSFGDTLASELGTVLGGEPFLITSLKRVPRGTNGGVTIGNCAVVKCCCAGGLIFSLLGGIIIGLVHYLIILYCVDMNLLALSPPQWPLILVGGLAGLFGSIFDSVLGATLQFSGVEKSTGCIMEYSGKNIIPVCGNQVLNNHSVNLLSTVFMGYMTPVIAKIFLL